MLSPHLDMRYGLAAGNLLPPPGVTMVMVLSLGFLATSCLLHFLKLRREDWGGVLAFLSE